MKKTILILALTWTLGASAMANPSLFSSSQMVAQEVYQAHDTSETSLDWPGIYQGLLPCGDYEGVETVLILRSDHSYTLVRRMLGETVLTDEFSGTFAWMADGDSIFLNEVGGAADKFKVGENRLWQLDSEGKMITGSLADSYLLSKVAESLTAPLQGVQWMLTDLNGSALPRPKEGERRPYFVLSKDGKVKGFAGCNSFSGNCEKSDQGEIKLSGFISTKMACPQLELETKFMQALESSERYEKVGTSLLLYSGKTLTAKLRAALPSE